MAAAGRMQSKHLDSSTTHRRGGALVEGYQRERVDLRDLIARLEGALVFVTAGEPQVYGRQAGVR